MSLRYCGKGKKNQGEISNPILSCEKVDSRRLTSGAPSLFLNSVGTAARYSLLISSETAELYSVRPLKLGFLVDAIVREEEEG